MNFPNFPETTFAVWARPSRFFPRMIVATTSDPVDGIGRVVAVRRAGMLDADYAPLPQAPRSNR